MSGRRSSLAGVAAAALGILVIVPRADAQSARAGVVTTVTGTATVARASLAQPAALRFKDNVFVEDRIATGESAFARLLLGGKAVVTIRERSAVTITEQPGASTVSVRVGRVAVSVVKSKMRPGEVIEVATPNALAAIRGTEIVAEVEPELQGVRSTITVLTGMIDVTRFDGVRPVGPVTPVGRLQRVVIRGAGPVGAPTAVTPEAGQGLRSEFAVQPARSPHATTPCPPPVVYQVVRQTLEATVKVAPVDGPTRTDTGGVIRVDEQVSGAGSALSTGAVAGVVTGGVNAAPGGTRVGGGSTGSVGTEGGGPLRLKLP